MRLIDADALPKYTGYALSAIDVAKAVENATTVDAVPIEDYKSMERTVNKLTKAIADAVEVVRCKDCFYCRKYNEMWQLPKRDVLLCIRLYGGDGEEVSAEDFCSRGERK